MSISEWISAFGGMLLGASIWVAFFVALNNWNKIISLVQPHFHAMTGRDRVDYILGSDARIVSEALITALWQVYEHHEVRMSHKQTKGVLILPGFSAPLSLRVLNGRGTISLGGWLTEEEKTLLWCIVRLTLIERERIQMPTKPALRETKNV